MLKDITVLVTACGAQFMPGLVNCLKDNGERNIRIVGTDMSDDKTLLQMVDAYYQVPSASDPHYIDVLLDICKKEKVDVVLPFMSADLLPMIDRLVDFENLGTKVSVSDRRSVEITTNKYLFYEFLKQKQFTSSKICKNHTFI